MYNLFWSCFAHDILLFTVFFVLFFSLLLLLLLLLMPAFFLRLLYLLDPCLHVWLRCTPGLLASRLMRVRSMLHALACYLLPCRAILAQP